MWTPSRNVLGKREPLHSGHESPQAPVAPVACVYAPLSITAKVATKAAMKVDRAVEEMHVSSLAGNGGRLSILRLL